MAETETAASSQPSEAIRMQMLNQFVRDVSFENVAAQTHLTTNARPDVNVQVGLDGKTIDAEKGLFEVSMKFRINSKQKDSDQVLFVLELDHVGIYEIHNIEKNQIHPYLLIECPRHLFPFSRRFIQSITLDGGFPPLNLENIDFMKLYRNEIERRREESQQGQQPAALEGTAIN